eukprot:8297505-Pyramimonas_sp.AAC.1
MTRSSSATRRTRTFRASITVPSSRSEAATRVTVSQCGPLLRRPPGHRSTYQAAARSSSSAGIDGRELRGG